jgi:His-Xaa-Ser system radical SAM maturase HxsC
MSYKLSAINKNLTDITHTSLIFLKVTHNTNLPLVIRKNYALIYDENSSVNDMTGWALILVKGIQVLPSKTSNIIHLNLELNHIGEDDVIKFNPANLSIRALFRNKANANAFLLTEKCNSLCIMCSQPPRDLDDKMHFESLFKSLPLIPKSTKEITFTGGEPTLNFPSFTESLKRAKFHLPNTAIHILSNGRNFQDKLLAKEVSNINHPDLMFGIPLYSDDEDTHDFVVQSKGAFTETIKGVMNLYKYRVPIEIRCVIHKYTYERLPQLAEFIARNLPFISHVNFMGLEREGYGKMNFDDLWIEPNSFIDKLEEAVNHLDMVGIPVRLYNYTQCMLPKSLRHRAVVSISDWKNEFREECDSCRLKPDCCGLFKSIASAKGVKVYPEYDN